MLNLENPSALVEHDGEEDQLFRNLLMNATLNIGVEIDEGRQVVNIEYVLQDDADLDVFNRYAFEMSLLRFRALLDKCVDSNIYPLINASRYGIMSTDKLIEGVKIFLSFNHRQKNQTIEADNIVHFINLDGAVGMTPDWKVTPSLKHLTSYKFTYENGASFAIASKRTEGFVRGTYTNTNKPNYLALATDKIRAYHEFENDTHFERFQIEEILNGIFTLHMPSLQPFAKQLILRKRLFNSRDPRA